MVRSDSRNVTGVEPRLWRICGEAIRKCVREESNSHLNVKTEDLWRAVDLASYEVSGQRMKLGLVRRGGVPTVEVVSDVIGATRDVFCA